MKFFGLGLLSVVGAVELGPDTFNAEVIDSGKNAFIKFQAPW
jgi:hypothetical protein